MSTDYTLKNLRDVEDLAVEGGFSDSQEARFADKDLGLESLGVSHQIVKPGKHHAFGHRHHEAEEVYVVLSGDREGPPRRRGGRRRAARRDPGRARGDAGLRGR